MTPETGACGAYGRAMEMDADFMKKEYGILQRVFRSANAPKKNLSIVSNEEAAKEFQASIDKAGDEYIAAVSSFRSIAKDKAEEEFGKGGTVDAGYALEHGMVDKIATIEELYEDISSRAEENAEGRGEDMEVNVNALSSEERARIFNEITALEPSLLASAIDEARKNAAANERSRIAALNALQVAGNAEIDALIKSAIEDGRSAGEIGLECFEIMKKASSEGKGAAGKAEAILGVLADDTAAVDVPQERNLSMPLSTRRSETRRSDMSKINEIVKICDPTEVYSHTVLCKAASGQGLQAALSRQGIRYSLPEIHM